MCETIEDQCAENRRSPNVPVTLEELAEIGIFTRKMNPETMLLAGPDGEPSELDRIMTAMGYKNRDEVCCAPGKLPDYENKLKMFFREHIHEDEEIRLIAAGSGYFDFRNAKDEWIRVLVTPGDFIVVPAGMYHRFTMDSNNYTHAIRLFSDTPKWIAIDRPCEDNPYRAGYVRDYVTNPVRTTVLGEVDASNILLSHPSAFDATVRPIIRSLNPDAKDLLVLYFTGTRNPKTHQSWCPDCVTSDPAVVAAVHAAKQKRTVVFVECTVERGSYLKNPEYLYRKHPFILLPSIPTVIVLESVRDEDGTEDVKQIVKQTTVDASWIASL